MYLFKNAVKNLYRNWGRNVLLAIIIFLIITAMSTSIMISNAMQDIVNQYKSQFDSEVFIIRNSESRSAERMEFTPKQLLAFSESDLLQKSHVIIRLSANMKDSSNKEKNSTIANIVLVGSSRKDISDEFKTEVRKVIEGRKIENASEVLISEQCAKKNNLKIGDNMEINLLEEEKISKTITVTIVGIYQDDVKDTLPFETAIFQRSNEIFMDFDYMANLKEIKNDYAMSAAIFSIKDPLQLQELQEEFYTKGLPKDYILTIDDTSYQKVIVPVEELTKMVNQFTTLIFIFGAIIIVILSSIMIKERKYEIGILRAIGMKKNKLFAGVFLESMLITLICLVLGLTLANKISNSLGNILLEIQPKVTDTFDYNEEGDQVIKTNDFGSVLNTSEPIDNLTVNLDKQIILQVMGMSILLVGIACVINAVYIMKYEPSKILKERN